MALVSRFEDDVVAQFFVVRVVDDVAEVVHEVGEGLGVDSAQAACGADSAKGVERDTRFGAGKQFVAGGFPVAVEAHPHLFEF